MSTVTAPPQEQAAQPTFDAKAYIAAKQSGKPIAEAREAATKPAELAKVETRTLEEPKEQPHVSRSVRRQLNKAMTEAAELRGRLALLEEQGKAKPATAPVEEKEPQRAAFPAGDVGTAEFLRATQKWDKAQDAKVAGKTQAETQQIEELKTFLSEMDTKAEEAVKALPDWEKVQAAAAADEDAPEFMPDQHPTLMALLARSDMRAYVLYHFAKPENYDALQALLDEKDNGKLISSFHRLEGRLEKLYDSNKPTEKKADKPAQGSKAEKPSEDRTHLAEAARPGEPQREVPAKPKPSSEVSARGGSPAPDEPRIGSPEWMAKRNQKLYGK